MFKEISNKIVDFTVEIRPLTTSENVTMKSLSLQDSISSKSARIQPVVKKAEIVSKTTSSSGVYRTDSLRIITTTELANINSIATVPSDAVSSTKVTEKKFPFHEGYVAGANHKNFLLDIPQKNLSSEFDKPVVSHTVSTTTLPIKESKALVKDTVVIQQPTGFQGNVRSSASLDWLPIILLVSLFTFSWIKMVYQKYVVQVVASLVNYQVSVRLLREKNVLFRNMSFGLNFVFSLNIGLFIFFTIQCFNLNQVHPNNFFSMAMYCLGVTILFNIKTVVCKLIGNLFLVKEQFAEYVHNIHLYNKNIGLFLFPIVIVYPYITNDQVKPIIINIGLFLVIGMSLLLVYRGFQIIMRSGVSIFYLILYLCAVEILPILILVKYSFTLI